MSYETLSLAIENRVATITINRPKMMNAFNEQLIWDMGDATEKVKNDSQIRVLVITGEGRGFSAGADLTERDASWSDTKDALLRGYYPFLKNIIEMPKPVICAVNGVAAGAGANIAIACDVTFAKASAKFIQAFVNIGLVPDSAGTFFLPKLIGMQRAAGLMFTGDKISAEEAERIGMIYKCVPDDDFDSTVDAFAKNLAEKPTKTIALIKDLLNQSNSNNWIQQLELEKKNQKIAANSNDHKEGINAFFEKRKPEYKGN